MKNKLTKFLMCLMILTLAPIGIILTGCGEKVPGIIMKGTNRTQLYINEEFSNVGWEFEYYNGETTETITVTLEMVENFSTTETKTNAKATISYEGYTTTQIYSVTEADSFNTVSIYTATQNNNYFYAKFNGQDSVKVLSYTNPQTLDLTSKEWDSSDAVNVIFSSKGYNNNGKWFATASLAIEDSTTYDIEIIKISDTLITANIYGYLSVGPVSLQFATTGNSTTPGSPTPVDPTANTTFNTNNIYMIKIDQEAGTDDEGSPTEAESRYIYVKFASDGLSATILNTDTAITNISLDSSEWTSSEYITNLTFTSAQLGADGRWTAVATMLVNDGQDSMTVTIVKISDTVISITTPDGQGGSITKQLTAVDSTTPDSPTPTDPTADTNFNTNNIYMVRVDQEAGTDDEGSPTEAESRYIYVKFASDGLSATILNTDTAITNISLDSSEWTSSEYITNLTFTSAQLGADGRWTAVATMLVNDGQDSMTVTIVKISDTVISITTPDGQGGSITKQLTAVE